MSAEQLIPFVITQAVMAIPVFMCVALLCGAGGGLIAGFHEKPSDLRAVKCWKKVCRLVALPILFCLALLDGSVSCFIFGEHLAGGLLMGAAVAEAVVTVMVFNRSEFFTSLIRMSADEYWREKDESGASE